MRDSLFRQEAVSAANETWTGKVVLVQPLSLRLLSYSVIVLAVLSLCFISITNYAQHLTLPGVLAPNTGLVKVQSPRNSIVQERRVKEGEHVKQGDILYVISAETVYAPRRAQQAGMAESALVQLRARQSLIEADWTATERLMQRERSEQRSRIASLDTELRQLDREIDLQTTRLTAKNSQFERYKEAQSHGFLSPLGLQQKHDELLEQKGRVQEVERAQIILKREWTAAKASLEILDQKFVLARSNSQRLQIEVENETMINEVSQRTLLTAPRSGTVASVFAEQGQRTDSQTLLTILPEDAVLEAQVLVPSRAIGLLREGDSVKVQVDSYPFHQYGNLTGRIISITHTSLTEAERTGQGLPSREISASALDGQFRLRICLPKQYLSYRGKQYSLRSGMQVEVQFPQRRQSLLAWIIDPLARFTEI